ncbi:MAG: PilT/PilU family type 4a pilus ATPase [Nitrosomonadales bacterium]|nr:PilT/PilU family type 4a pilus ATPase [Nitrosomonadales bacterium]
MERAQATELIHNLLRGMLSKKASDLFVTTGFPPAFKMDGKLTAVSPQALTSQHTQELARSIMNDRQAAEFEAKHECNFAISPPGIGRFRVNVFMQQQRVGMVLRTITTKIPDLDEMGLPPVLKDVVMTKRGLVILVGGTGSGKSTTLAAMLGHRNKNSYGHIITIEDPVEYVHDHINCIITHREVGVDTESWEAALKNTLRQAPDVILIGEIRDRETMEHAVAFAETGHLCLATLHANSANQALDRIINFFPEERIADQIFKGEVNEIKGVMSRSRELGMQTFDQALFDLYEAGKISYEEALKNADSLNDLRLNIKLNSKASKDADVMSGIDHLKMT